MRLSLSKLESSTAAESLPDFVYQYWSVIEPGNPLKWNWHHDLIVEELMLLDSGENKRLIVNIPPGCSKSTLISVMFPCWQWATRDWMRFLTFSYSDVNTIRDNRAARLIVTSEKYQSAFPLRLSQDQNVKVKFETTARGWRIASSVAGLGTGDHPHGIIIDDPNKATEARSPVKLKVVENWQSSTVSTRLALDPYIVLVMQRLAEKDISGRLQSKGGWRLLRLPMRYRRAYKNTQNKIILPDVRDPRKVEGELLYPQVWNEEKLKQNEIELGPFGIAGQHQQDPVPLGGGLFKREKFKMVSEAPKSTIWCRSWDTGETGEDEAREERKDADFTVGTKVGYHQESGQFYTSHNIRSRVEDPNGLIMSTATADGKSILICEGSGNGKSNTAARGKLLAGWDYTVLSDAEDKVSKAGPFRSQVELGNWNIVLGEWDHELYLDVICSFPVGEHDDDVDATANAVRRLIAAPPPRRLTWGR